MLSLLRLGVIAGKPRQTEGIQRREQTGHVSTKLIDSAHIGESFSFDLDQLYHSFFIVLDPGVLRFSKTYKFPKLIGHEPESNPHLSIIKTKSQPIINQNKQLK
jgi:hypothetical protein